MLGLLGPNGAGKTTAVRILTTLLRPDAGVARVLGIDVAAEPARTRAVIGLAGQYAAVDENLTGRENLRLVGRLTHLPARETRERSDELLERFELVDAADRLVRTFSGGMRRRLDLAAALVHQPPVLFLDEPTTGLDPYGRTELWRVIEELVDVGTTLLLTTQYLEEADRLADRIVVIDHGLIIAEGTAERAQGPAGDHRHRGGVRRPYGGAGPPRRASHARRDRRRRPHAAHERRRRGECHAGDRARPRRRAPRAGHDGVARADARRRLLVPHRPRRGSLGGRPS